MPDGAKVTAAKGELLLCPFTGKIKGRRGDKLPGRLYERKK